MSKAVYDKLDDGTFTGKIPPCPGVVSFGETLYQCEQELRSSLEGWLIVKNEIEGGIGKTISIETWEKL